PGTAAGAASPGASFYSALLPSAAAPSGPSPVGRVMWSCAAHCGTASRWLAPAAIRSTAQLQRPATSEPAGRFRVMSAEHSAISLSRLAAGAAGAAALATGAAVLAAGAAALALLLPAPLLQPASRQSEVMTARPKVTRMLIPPGSGRSLSPAMAQQDANRRS